MSYRSIRELAEAAGIDFTYDTALPLGWCEDVKRLTGEWPYEMVWGYPQSSVWGLPVALTPEAKLLLRIYLHVKAAEGSPMA